MKCNKYSEAYSQKSCCSALLGSCHQAAEINNYREPEEGLWKGGKNQCRRNVENKISVASLRDYFNLLTLYLFS